MLGVLIILNTIILTTWWVLGEHLHKNWAMCICIIAIFVGIFFILQDRAIEISFKWLGTIKAAAKQAATDAETIAKIKERIESQSATVDLVAQSAAEVHKTTTEIAQKNEILEEKVKELNNLISKATDKLQTLENITEFSKITIAAQNDDRRAFDVLKSWVENKSFPMRKEATNVFVKIRADYGGPIEPGYMNISWPKDVDPNKLSISDLRKIYKSSVSLYHADIVNFIQKRTDIPKEDRMAFFIDVVREDGSLNATSYAGKFFAKEAGIEWQHFVVEPLLKWWEENKDKIE